MISSRSQSAARVSRIFCAALGLALALVPALARADGCTDYGSSVRWAAGQESYPVGPSCGDSFGCSDVAVTGHLLFAAHDDGLYAEDVTNPDQPALLGILGRSGDRVKASGTLAYELERGAPGPVIVVNAANPAAMFMVGSVNLPDPRDLSVIAPYVYVADGASGLAVVLASGAPVLVGSVSGIGTAIRVAAVSSRAYVVTDTGLWVINISTPIHPTVTGHLTPTGSFLDVSAGGDGYLYVLDSAAGLQILSLTNPDSPALVGSLPISSPRMLTALNHQVMVSYGAGIGHVDATVPASPVLTGSYKGEAMVGGAIYGSTLFVAANQDGRQVLDFSHPTNPAEAAFVADGAGGQSLCVNGNVLTMVRDGELVDFDVTHPLTPFRLGSYPLTHGAGVSVVGGRAYAMDQSGLKILDLTDPAHPSLLGAYAGNFNLIATDGQVAVVAQAHNLWLYWLNVSNPGSITLINQLQWNEVLGLASIGSTGYVLSSFECSTRVDSFVMSGPSLGSIESEGGADGPETGLAAGANAVFVTGPYLAQLNPSTLASIGEIGVLPYSGAVAVGTSHVYTWNGIAAGVFSTSPLAYQGTAFTTAGSHAGGVAEVGSYLYAADAAGLHIFTYPCDASGVPPASGRPETSGAAASPDPFHGGTSLRFDLEASRSMALAVYDPAGRLVRTLLPGGVQAAGRHSVSWDGRDENGRPVPAGIYFARLSGGGRTATTHLVKLP